MFNNDQVRIKGSTCFNLWAAIVQKFENGAEVVRENTVSIFNPVVYKYFCQFI